MDRFYIQPLHHPSELRLPIPALRVLRIDPENPMPVRIKCQRTAMRQDVIPKCLQIRPRRLGRHETQGRQTARRIVDEHDQRATRAAILKPRVRASVDLDQFAKPRTPFPRLKHTPDTPALRLPELLTDLKLADCLPGNRNTFQFQQLLRRERRAEVFVLLFQ